MSAFDPTSKNFSKPRWRKLLITPYSVKVRDTGVNNKHDGSHLLSFRPEPERSRRRSGGTCFLCRDLDLGQSSPISAAIDKGGAGLQACAKYTPQTTGPHPLRLTPFVIPTAPRANSTAHAFCHSDRSRSDSDGVAEEPAFCDPRF